MSEQKLRMDAYYYGFDLTGAPEIDLILSAVACAGKSFHHTDQWNEQSDPWPAHTGNSPAEWIQNAAIIAAEGNKLASELIAQLKAENAALRKDAVFHSHTQRQAELYQSVQLAAGSLPDGWEIRLYIEKHSGYVELFNPDGDELEDFASNRESLAETISDALEAAIAKEVGHDQA